MMDQQCVRHKTSVEVQRELGVPCYLYALPVVAVSSERVNIPMRINEELHEILEDNLLSRFSRRTFDLATLAKMSDACIEKAIDSIVSEQDDFLDSVASFHPSESEYTSDVRYLLGVALKVDPTKKGVVDGVSWTRVKKALKEWLDFANDGDLFVTDAMLCELDALLLADHVMTGIVDCTEMIFRIGEKIAPEELQYVVSSEGHDVTFSVVDSLDNDVVDSLRVPCPNVAIAELFSHSLDELMENLIVRAPADTFVFPATNKSSALLLQ